MQASGGMTPVCPRRTHARAHKHTHTRIHWKETGRKKESLSGCFIRMAVRKAGEVGSRLTPPLNAEINRKATNTHRSAATVPVLLYRSALQAPDSTRKWSNHTEQPHLSPRWAFVARHAAYYSTFIKEWAVANWFLLHAKSDLCFWLYNSCSTTHTQTHTHAHTDKLALHSHTQACQPDLLLLN